jgi:hypothetical protein
MSRFNKLYYIQPEFALGSAMTLNYDGAFSTEALTAPNRVNRENSKVSFLNRAPLQGREHLQSSFQRWFPTNVLDALLIG